MEQYPCDSPTGGDSMGCDAVRVASRLMQMFFFTGCIRDTAAAVDEARDGNLHVMDEHTLINTPDWRLKTLVRIAGRAISAADAPHDTLILASYSLSSAVSILFSCFPLAAPISQSQRIHVMEHAVYLMKRCRPLPYFTFGNILRLHQIKIKKKRDGRIHR